MKIWALIAVLLIGLTSFSQSVCDSLNILNVNVDAFNENQLNISVLNENTAEIFSYPGFRVYDQDNNLIGEEEVFFFGIGGESTHAVFFNSSIFGFNAGQNYTVRLELWVNFYDSLVCEFEVETILVPDPEECVPVLFNFIEFSQQEVSYTYTLFDYWNNVIEEEVLIFADDVGNITRNICIDASCYTLKVVSDQIAEESNMVINLVADGNAGFLSETLLDDQIENELEFSLWTDCSLINSTENLNSIEFELYPNPARDYLFLNLSGNDTQFKISTVTGKTLLEGNATNLKKIDIISLAPGIYFLSLFQDQNWGSKPFVKY
ncbi:MAG: T9SS type A sorting domain-containing protein [Bacteroidota bacterium]